MASQVRVDNVGQLENYRSQLKNLKTELETSAGQLQHLADEVKNKVGQMQSVTNQQNSNWHDPQYNKLKSDIDPCISAVNSMSESIRQNAGIVKAQMQKVEESISYLNALISKLNQI